jgi:hypothetical protein
MRRTHHFNPLYYIGTAVVLATVLGGAMPSPAQAATCSFNESLGALRKLHLGSGVEAELAARRNVLAALLDCAAEEAQELQTDIGRLETRGNEAKSIQRAIVQKLTESISFYRTKRASVNELGIRGTQEVARQVREWRAYNYAPFAHAGLNFMFWSENETLIETARVRLEHIGTTVRTLKLVDNEELQKRYAQAQESFSETETLHRQALASIQKFDDPKRTQELIKTSLEKLSQTYRLFFQISDAVRGILPH